MKATQWYVPVGAAVLAATVAGAVIGAEPQQTAEQIISELADKAKSAQSGCADVKMTMPMMGQTMTMEGTMLFKKPRKSRMEMTMNMGAIKMEQVTIVDGATIWTYQPTLKMATKIDAQKLAAETGIAEAGQSNNTDLSRPFGGLQRESIKLVGTEDLAGSDVYLLEGAPKTAGMPDFPFKPAKIQVWVGVEDGLLHKMTMLDQKGGEMMSMTFSNIQLNVEAPDSQFQFTPPEGVNVMDITEVAINMMKAMKPAEEEPAEKE